MPKYVIKDKHLIKQFVKDVNVDELVVLSDLRDERKYTQVIGCTQGKNKYVWLDRDSDFNIAELKPTLDSMLPEYTQKEQLLLAWGKEELFGEDVYFIIVNETTFAWATWDELMERERKGLSTKPFHEESISALKEGAQLLPLE